MSIACSGPRCAPRTKIVLWIGAYVLAALLNGCGVEAAFAQAKPQPAATAQTVSPSTTESIALQALASALQHNGQERQQLEAQLHAVEAEIAKEHPGYHFDEAAGAIVKDAPKPEPAKK